MTAQQLHGKCGRTQSSIAEPRHSRWSKSGVWEQVFRHLAAEADNEYAMIDSTIVRAHQHSAGAEKKSAQTAPARTRQSDDPAVA